MPSYKRIQAMEKRAKAKDLLFHYFAQVMPNADSDTRVELGEIVDHIIDAAILEVEIAAEAER